MLMIPWRMSWWPHMTVLTQVFLILLHTLCQSTPWLSRYFQNVLKDHLCPVHSSGDSLCSNSSLFLLTLKLSSHLTSLLNIVSPVVGEVSVFICQMIVLEWEGSGGQSDQTILVNIEFDGVNTGQENVDTKIKLESSYQHGVGDVALDDGVADTVRNLLDSPRQDDSVTLRSSRRFADPEGSVVVLLDPHLQLSWLGGEVECFRHEGKVSLTELLLHHLEVVPHQIFPVVTDK